MSDKAAFRILCATSFGTFLLCMFWKPAAMVFVGALLLCCLFCPVFGILLLVKEAWDFRK